MDPNPCPGAPTQAPAVATASKCLDAASSLAQALKRSQTIPPKVHAQKLPSQAPFENLEHRKASALLHSQPVQLTYGS